MNRHLCLGLGALVAGALILQPSAANQDSKYELAKKRFDQLKQNATPVEGLRTQPYTTRVQVVGKARFQVVPNDQVNIKPVPSIEAGKENIQLGIRIWFQLDKDKKYVNPVKHRWSPKERFHIFVEAAVPVQIHLFQNYPDDRPPSKVVYPDEKYPETFATVLPGKPYELPVLFEMDDDLRKEIVSMVVARADATLPVNQQEKATETASDDSSKSGPGGVFRVKIQQTHEMMLEFNKEAMTKETIQGKSSRLVVVGPEGPNGQQPMETSRSLSENSGFRLYVGVATSFVSHIWCCF